MNNKLPLLLRLNNTNIDKITNNYKSTRNPTKKKKRKKKKK